MLRALATGFAGILYFVVSLLLFIPFRMKPIANYNLCMLPLLSAIALALFYKVCTVTEENRAYQYAYACAILMWQVLGEIASVRVPEGMILQFSGMNIKILDAYIYVAALWILLHILWRTKAIANRFLFLMLIFLSIWSFELYMDNYSSRIAVDAMPNIANIILVVFLVITIVILYVANKATTVEKKTAMGGLLYITLCIVIMTLPPKGQWRKPQAFYLKYEKPAIEIEIKNLQEELENIKKLQEQMGIAKKEEAPAVPQQKGQTPPAPAEQGKQ
jgi:hypothetical protein